jgi:hypothetical protein
MRTQNGCNSPQFHIKLEYRLLLYLLTISLHFLELLEEPDLSYIFLNKKFPDMQLKRGENLEKRS